MRTLWYYWLFVEHFVCDSVKQMHEQVDNVCKTKTILDTQTELVRQKNVGKSFANTSTNHGEVLTHPFFIFVLSKASRQMCVGGVLHSVLSSRNQTYYIEIAKVGLH